MLHAKVLLLCCSISLALGGKEFCEKDACSESTAKCRTLHVKPGDPSIWLIHAKGRLGNHLMSYALVMALQKATESQGVRVFVTQETRDFLTKYFEDLSVPVLERDVCNHQDLQFKYYVEGIDELVDDQRLRSGHLLDLWPLGYKNDAKKCCPTQELYEFVRSQNLEEIKSSLVFKPEFQSYVSEKKEKASKRIGIPVEEITFVGIHNRRTDYLPYMEDKFGLKNPFTKKYFKHAMEYFREDNDHTVFFYVSDDMPWGRQNIKNKEKDLFFVGQGDGDSDEAIGRDLALLASCNHTIVTWGTFSMWVATLSGGEYYTQYGVIVPKEIQEPEKKKKKRRK